MWSANDDVDRQDAELTARRFIELLPRRTARVVDMRLQGFSYADLATCMGISPKTVDAHLQKARKILRLRIEREREREREQPLSDQILRSSSLSSADLAAVTIMSRAGEPFLRRFGISSEALLTFHVY
jgi:FixJ family two-component response regulator